MKSPIYFTALETFDADKVSGFTWNEYINWYDMQHLKELVSLDGNLNRLSFLPDLNAPDEWQAFITENKSVMFYFKSFDYVLDKVKDLSFFNLLAIIKNPTKAKADLATDYDFIGYDLIEKGGDTSALTNGGGYDNTFLSTDLNTYGLISEYNKAKTILEELPLKNPDEPSVNCYLYEVWRHKIIGRKTN